MLRRTLARSFALVGLVGLISAMGLGCGDGEGGVGGGIFGTDLSGDLTVESPTADPLTFTPDTCLSGQRQGFNGVSLYLEGSDLVVDIVDDPLDGLAIALSLPGACDGRGSCPPTVIRASECPDLRGEVFVNPRVTTNNIWHAEGWLTLRCDLPEDGLVFGELNFEGCH